MSTLVMLTTSQEFWTVLLAVRYMSLSVRLSSVCLYVCAPTGRLKFSTMFLRHLVHRPPIDIQVKFYGDHPRGTPLSGELNTRGVAKYSDFGPIKRYISETVQDRS